MLLLLLLAYPSLWAEMVHLLEYLHPNLQTLPSHVGNSGESFSSFYNSYKVTRDSRVNPTSLLSNMFTF